jgi:hypothetical protein
MTFLIFILFVLKGSKIRVRVAHEEMSETGYDDKMLSEDPEKKALKKGTWQVAYLVRVYWSVPSTTSHVIPSP